MSRTHLGMCCFTTLEKAQYYFFFIFFLKQGKKQKLLWVLADWSLLLAFPLGWVSGKLLAAPVSEAFRGKEGGKETNLQQALSTKTLLTIE